MLTAKSCLKCGGSTYKDDEDLADVCIQCGSRHYYGTVGTREDVEGRRKRKGVNNKHDGSYYGKSGHSPKGLFT